MILLALCTVRDEELLEDSADTVGVSGTPPAAGAAFSGGGATNNFAVKVIEKKYIEQVRRAHFAEPKNLSTCALTRETLAP